MIEAVMTFDLLPHIDMKAYEEWVEKLADAIENQPGIVEFRANRSILGSPMSRSVTTFRSLEDWAKFTEGPWHFLGPEFRRFATNIHIELWGPSPIVKEPVRPAPHAGAN